MGASLLATPKIVSVAEKIKREYMASLHSTDGGGKGKAKAKAKRSDKGKGKAKDSVRSGTISYQHQLKSALASIHLGGILYAFMGHSTRGRGWKFAGVRRRMDG